MKLKAKSIFTVILLVITIFTLTACNGLTPNPTGEEKAVPAYQGMVVSETLSTLSANDSINPNIMRLSNIGVTRNLNTNPIDQDDPFGTLDDGTISEVITNEFPVTQTEVADYYSEINKDIFITVKLSNPDNFVILSFTLNGVFYQSYQFQDGSDSENLILKVNTGNVSGVKEYTIDAIKYIDGTETKDATFAGERTITVGLKHNSEPSVLVSDEVVNATSILLTVNLSDSKALSTLNKIVLYDGESLVQIYDLSLGENNIVFDKLNISTLYQYAVISVYDLIDGNNSRLSLLEKKALYTDDIVSIDNVIPTQTSIGFGITVTDVDQVGSVSAIELFQGETLVEALTDLSVREFTGLLSNNEYTIKVTYTYDLNDGVGEQSLVISKDIKTLMKATPEVVVDNVVPTQDSVAFDITVTDTDEVGAITAIELYQGETLIESLSDLTLREFTGLLSNNAYTIKVTYTYDLNDGVGSQTLITSQAATTVAKSTPVVLIENIVPTQDSITFEINVTDVDQVGFITAIELYKGETLIEALSDLSVRTFSNLLSNNAYQIKVTYTYDLNDGLGEQELITTETVTTLAKATPEVVVDNVVPTQDSVAFDITVTDADEVGAITAIELYQGETLIEALTDLSSRTFSDLLSNNAYQIKVTYTYDLNDGVGSQTLTINQAATTLAKATPTLTIDNVVPIQESISFGITVTDADEVGSITAIELYQGETLIESLTDLTLREFTGLLSNNEYTIKVTYTYDLNDGVGEQSLVISKDIKTLAKATPVVLIENIVPTQDSITFEINVTDVDQVGSITAIELYKGETLVEALTDLDLRTFTNLLSNNEYQVKVTYTYDLNDGIEDQFLNIDKAITTIKLLPIVGFDIVNIDRNNVSYTINIDDNDKSLINIHNIRAIIIQPKSYPYEQERQEIIDLGIDLAGYINNIDSGNTHTIEVIVLVDLNDGLGLTEKTFVHYFNTIMMEISFDLNSSVITQNSLTFNLWEIDLNLAGRTNLNFTLYNDGLTEIISNEFDESPEMLYGWILEYEHTFYNLLSNSKYILVIEFFTDLDDGLGERKFTHQIELQTKAKVKPEVLITDVVLTQDSVSFDLDVTDADQVGSITSIELYKGETLVEAFTDLSVREFTGLLSNNEYTVKVTYTYDLNDGLGSQALTINQVSTTVAKATPVVVVDNVVPTQTSIGFGITVTDVDQVGAVSAIELYKGETLVEALTDLSVREFTGLLSNTEYTIKVSYIYDLNDGQGNHNLKVRTYNYLIADKFQDSNQSEGYVWGLIHAKIDSNKSIYLINPLTGNLNINIKVYFEDITIQEFNTLGYGDKIIIYGTFINGYVLGVFNTVEKRDTIDNVKTKEKQTPSAVIDNVVPTQTSVGFGITVTDVDQVGAISAIELYKGETLVETLTDLSVREFTGLLSNNEYTIKVTYTYDLNDGAGSQTLITSQAATTVAKATPVVAIDNVVPTQTSIGLGIMVTDVDQVGAISAIELYKGETLIKVLTDLSLREFTGLLSNNEYTIKVTYTYDLNDGIGEQTLTINQNTFTIPRVEIIGFSIAGSSTVTYDDTLVLKISINNPTNVIVKSVNINGKDYDVSSTIQDDLFVNIIISSEYIEGTITFNIESLTITGLAAIEYVVEVSTEHSVSATLYLPLILDNVYVESSSGEVTNGIQVNDDYYIVLFFENIINTTIGSISINGIEYSGSQLMINLDMGTVKILMKAPSNIEYVRLYINEIDYINIANQSKTIYPNSKNVKFASLYDTQIREIYTAEQLQSLQSGYSYAIMNNIDLTDFEWTPIEFLGIVDGNGFEISNLSIIGSYSGQPEYIGLFSKFTGSMLNIQLTDVLFLINYDNEVNPFAFGSGYASIGGLVGRLEYDSEIFSSSVTGSIFLTLTLEDSYMWYHGVGGLVGESWGNIYDSFSNMNIETNSVYVGGLVGFVNSGFINSSYSIGAISGNEFVGGLLGGGRSASIINSFSLAESSGNGLIGGYNTEINHVFDSFSIQLDQFGTTVNDYQIIYDVFIKTWNSDIWYFGNYDINSIVLPVLINRQ